MAEESKKSEDSDTSVEVVTEETVEVTEEVEEHESETSAGGKKKKKKSKKKKPAKKKKQKAAAPGTSKKRKKKKRKAEDGSIVWAYPRKPAIAPSFPPCPHIYFKHSIVDRSKLNQQKYDVLLATPRSEPWKEPEEKLQKFRRRPITPRTECLALPQKRKMEAQLVEYHNILTPQMLENLGILLGTNCDLTSEPVVIYPYGTNPITSKFLKEWCNWLYESLSKVSIWAGWLHEVLDDASVRVIRQQNDKKRKGPRKPKEDQWLGLVEEFKNKKEDWNSTTKSIMKTGKKWETFMKKRPDKKEIEKKKCC